jgi:hypothetical protein
MSAGYDTYQNCTLSWKSFRTVIEFTGFAVDDCRDEADLVNALERSVVNAARTLRDLINTTWLGTASGGLQHIISSTTSYGGIARGTYTTWKSYQVTTCGALTQTKLEDMIEALQDNDRGVDVSELVLLAPWNQITNIRRFAGWSGSGAAVQPYVQPGGVLELGWVDQKFNGIPIMGVPDMTDTVILALHRPSFYVVEHRPLTFEEKDNPGDGRRWHLTWRGALVSEAPHKCGKLATVTA